MLVRAKVSIRCSPKGNMQPGDVFVVSDDEGQRLIKLDAVEPVKKMINLQMDASSRDAKGDTDHKRGE